MRALPLLAALLLLAAAPAAAQRTDRASVRASVRVEAPVEVRYGAAEADAGRLPVRVGGPTRTVVTTRDARGDVRVCASAGAGGRADTAAGCALPAVRPAAGARREMVVTVAAHA